MSESWAGPVAWVWVIEKGLVMAAQSRQGRRELGGPSFYLAAFGQVIFDLDAQGQRRRPGLTGIPPVPIHL